MRPSQAVEAMERISEAIDTHRPDLRATGGDTLGIAVGIIRESARLKAQADRMRLIEIVRKIDELSHEFRMNQAKPSLRQGTAFAVAARSVRRQIASISEEFHEIHRALKASNGEYARATREIDAILKRLRDAPPETHPMAELTAFDTMVLNWAKAPETPFPGSPEWTRTPPVPTRAFGSP